MSMGVLLGLDQTATDAGNGSIGPGVDFDADIEWHCLRSLENTRYEYMKLHGAAARKVNLLKLS